MIRINLLSEGRRPVAAKRAGLNLNFGGQDTSVYFLAAGLIVGALAAGIWWFLLNGEVGDNQRKIRRAEKEYEQLRPIIEEVDDFKLKKADRERKITVIKDLQAKQRGPVFLMDQVSRALPELLWLEQMTVSGTNVTLRGKAFNTNAIAAFITNLKKIPEFEEPFLRDMPADRGGSTYSFNINLSFAYRKLQEEAKAEDSEGGSLGDGTEEVGDVAG